MSLASLPSRVSVTAPLGLPEVAGDPLNVGIVWDAENRLTEVRQGATTLATFSYDGLGKRVQKTAGGVTHTYISDGSSIIEDRVSAGQTLRYVEGPRIDQHLAMQDGATVTYYVPDHLGSVMQETNSSGVVTLARKYDPWGNMLVGGTSAGWAFTGREWDTETGLTYHRARYYSPAAGRFLSEDPVRFAAGPNFYRYVRGRVVSHSDPFGLVEMGGPNVAPAVPGAKGTVECRGGKVVIVVAPPSDREWECGITICFVRHERVHEREVNKTCPKYCEDKPDGSQPQYPDDQARETEERKAYLAEVRCLMKAPRWTPSDCQRMHDCRLRYIACMDSHGYTAALCDRMPDCSGL